MRFVLTMIRRFRIWIRTYFYCTVVCGNMFWTPRGGFHPLYPSAYANADDPAVILIRGILDFFFIFVNISSQNFFIWCSKNKNHYSYCTQHTASKELASSDFHSESNWNREYFQITNRKSLAASTLPALCARVFKTVQSGQWRFKIYSI